MYIIIIFCKKKNFNIKCKFIGHTEPISNMYWNPDGTQLLTCSNDKSIRLWDIKVCSNQFFINLIKQNIEI